MSVLLDLLVWLLAILGGLGVAVLAAAVIDVVYDRKGQR